MEPTLKAILTTIFILNLIIAKDFMKKDKSNGDKIKSIEKIWSKQLLATEIKIEENSAEPTSRVVKAKDHLFCLSTASFFRTAKVHISVLVTSTWPVSETWTNLTSLLILVESLFIDTDPGPIMEKYNISSSGLNGRPVQNRYNRKLGHSTLIKFLFE